MILEIKIGMNKLQNDSTIKSTNDSVLRVGSFTTKCFTFPELINFSKKTPQNCFPLPDTPPPMHSLTFFPHPLRFSCKNWRFHEKMTKKNTKTSKKSLPPKQSGSGKFLRATVDDQEVREEWNRKNFEKNVEKLGAAKKEMCPGAEVKCN